jgi:hypothetical protein
VIVERWTLEPLSMRRMSVAEKGVSPGQTLI